MKILEKQVAALRAGVYQRTTDAVLVEVRARLRKETEAMTEPDLRALVRSGIERAVRYHLRGQEHLVRYVELMVGYGSTFDVDPQNCRVLASCRLSPEAKLTLVERRLGRRATP